MALVVRGALRYHPRISGRSAGHSEELGRRLPIVATVLSLDDWGRMRRSILTRSAITTVPVAVFASAYFALWQPPYGNYSWLVQVFINVGEAFLYVGVIFLLGRFLFRRRWLARHEDWAVGRRPITEADRDDLVAVPGRAAGACFAATFATLTAGIITDATTGIAAPQVIGYGIFWFLLAFTFASIVYLQTEAALRPLYARAFETSLPEHGTVKVMPRLAVSWAVGSAVPLLLVAVIPLRPASHHDLPVVVPMLFMALGGVLVGGITAVVAAHSVAEPVDAVRAGLKRVRDGDIEGAVEVSSPGDLGALEAGFNDMVEAIRSRRQLEDLFGRHVGEEVARQALQQGVALGGDRREVGVIFVDLIDSTRLVQSRSPEVVVDLLNEFFAAIVRVVGAEGGWVNKFEGDGALCVFGAPVSTDDYAIRALRAARTIRREVLALAAIHPFLDAAVGVSAGTVVAGNIGAEQRFEYTVIGTPVNEAARLTDEAKHRLGRVLASEEAVARAGPEAPFWLVAEEIRLRGHDEPILVYEPSKALGVDQPV